MSKLVAWFVRLWLSVSARSRGGWSRVIGPMPALRSAAVLIVLTGVFSKLSATTVVPPEFSALVNESDYIVHAKVRRVESEKRATAGGGSKLVTLIDLEVIEIVAGTPPAEIRLEMLGGKVGDEELTVAGMPRFKVGDEDILFVSGNGRSISPLFAMMHGRYPIGHDALTGRRFIARENGVPLSDPAEIALPMPGGGAAELQRRQRSVSEAMTPEEFIGKIRAAVTAEARLNRAK